MEKPIPINKAMRIFEGKLLICHSFDQFSHTGTNFNNSMADIYILYTINTFANYAAS